MRIAVVAPSRMLPQDAVTILESVQKSDPRFSDLDVEIAAQCFLQSGHFAGSDQERASALIEAANDPEIDAVWFARGGYGAGRIIDLVLPKLNDAAKQKTYVGYSDAGYLLAALHRAKIGRCVHGPMVADGLRNDGAQALRRVLDWFVDGLDENIEPRTQEKGAFAFNTMILASLAATPYLPHTDGEVLMIEEVGEHLYAFDRALLTAFASGRFANLKGLYLGRVSDIPENDIPFGRTPEKIVQDWCCRYDVPYLGRADIGHDVRNQIVPFPDHGQ
ncbi:MAG: LD-carboxypeptidase [Pseudomonadota bacterium]